MISFIYEIFFSDKYLNTFVRFKITFVNVGREKIEINYEVNTNDVYNPYKLYKIF